MRGDISLDSAAWEEAVAGLSPPAVALAMMLTVQVCRSGYEPVGEPAFFDFDDWSHRINADAQQAWHELAPKLSSINGHYDLPWLVRQAGKGSKRGARYAWKNWLDRKPLVGDPTYQRAWTDFHEMRLEKGDAPWPDKTCALWLDRKHRTLGRDLMVLTLQLSVERGWTGLFPEAASKLNGVPKGKKMPANSSTTKVAARDLLRKLADQ